MQLIKDIEIAYFRSFYKESIRRCDNLNIIFGKNDAGKSNIVRALNLFFNNETDYSAALDFEVDFSDARKTEASESEDVRKFLYIKITFNTPKNYQKSLGNEFYVKRQWTVSRGTAFVEESSNHIKSNQKHIITRFLNLIKFIYIPAIKDEAIFQNLLRDVYHCIATQADFAEAVSRFTDDVRLGTSEMFKELEDVVGSTTRISAPNRLEELFETLDFETKLHNSHYTKSLTKQRGDGIKVRHIPELLKFISRNDGFTYHIWGFEEPENSLDFHSATLEAERFRAISKSNDVQIFLTTHSPSFYNISKSDGVFRVYVRGEHDGSKILQGKTLDQASDQSLMEDGFYLPLIAEKLSAAQSELEHMNQQILHIKNENDDLASKILNSEKPVLLVEGPSDKILFDHIFSLFENSNEFNVYCAEGTGNLDIFRKKRDFLKDLFGDRKIFIVVDADGAGIQSLPNGFTYNQSFKKDPSGYYWRTLPISQSQTKLLSQIPHAHPFFGIEDMFDPDLLEEGKSEGKLSLGDKLRPGIKAQSITTIELISADKKLLDRLREIDPNCKTIFAKWLMQQTIDSKTINGFKEIYDDILRNM